MRKQIFITLVALIGTVFCVEGAVEDYVLPANHPLQKKLSGLFNQVRFDNRLAARDGGFLPIPRIHRGMMVMNHPNVPGYLFKKFYDSKLSSKKEEQNFIRRIEGARRLKALIAEKKLKHIVAPEKWLYRLPDQDRYILVVEKVNLLKDKKTKERYGTISKEVLQELCIVLNHMRGLDSVIPNMPFTKDDKIAFIDTERWAENRPDFLHHAKHYLSDKDRKYAESLKNF